VLETGISVKEWGWHFATDSQNGDIIILSYSMHFAHILSPLGTVISNVLF
jgi:hypothetical protein